MWLHPIKQPWFIARPCHELARKIQGQGQRRRVKFNYSSIYLNDRRGGNKPIALLAVGNGVSIERWPRFVENNLLYIRVFCTTVISVWMRKLWELWLFRSCSRFFIREQNKIILYCRKKIFLWRKMKGKLFFFDNFWF